MNLERMTREELASELQELLESQTEKERKTDALLHDLRVHQLELELQNRNLRETQSALEAARARFEDLYDFAPAAYFTFDLHGKIQEVNLTGASMIGKDRSRLLGMPFLPFVKMDEPATFWMHIRRCVETRKPVVSEFSFSTDRLGPIDVQAASTPVLDALGNVTALRTSLTDVSDRKRMQLELERANRNEKLLRIRFEALDAAALHLNRALAGEPESADSFLRAIVDEARTIAEAQYAALGIGDDPDRSFSIWTFSGMSESEAAAIGHYPRPRGLLGEVIVTGESIRLHDLREHPAFVGFPAHHPEMRSFLGVPIRYGGKVLGNLYLTDKSSDQEFGDDDQKVIEMFAERVGVALEIDRLAKEVRSAVRARDTVLAVVSHDLRNPLSIIDVTAQILTHENANLDRNASRRHLDRILRSAREMTRLIGDLLDSAAIEGGGFTVQTRSSAVLSIVEPALEPLETIAAQRSVHLHRDVPPDLPDIQCDPERMAQVLSNLVGNAIKFVRDDGNVTIRARAQPAEVKFSVSDDGPGIGEDRMAYLFERFSRAKAKGASGTGLGLFIAKGIIDAHGGRIWAESRIGEGSTFHFTVPTAGSGAHAEDQARASAGSGPAGAGTRGPPDQIND